MARKPEVFVRALTDEEQQRLLGITRRSRDPVRLRRAMIVQMSAQGRSPGVSRAGPKMERGSAHEDR